MDDQRKEDPNVSFNLSMASIDNKLSEINDSLEAIELNTDHVLWKAQRKLSRKRTKLLQVKTVTPAASTESTPKGSYKLADLSIPKFHGKLDEWLTFWGEFELAINEKKDMSNSIKLVYLKQSILDPELKSSITDLGIGPKAYPEAIKLLHDRYNKPRLIHRQYCEELSSVASMPKSKGYIGRLASKGTHLMAGFQRLKMTGVSEVLTSAAMPTELRHVWYTQTSKLSTTPPIEDLVQFLREREDQERAEDSIAPVKSSEKSKGHKPKNRGSSHMTSAPPSASPAVVLPAAPVSVPQPREVPPVVRKDFPPCRYPCPLCQGEKHYPYHCETFKAYSPSQRNSHVQAHNLCVNCLKPGHTPSTCRSTYKCKVCSQAHNSLLHDNQANSSNPAVLSTNVTNTGVKSCIQDTLLTTAEVLLTGTNGVTLVARALLDSGSTLSIISTKTRNTPALKSLGSSVCIDGVGGAGSSTPCPMVNLHLSSSYRPDWHTDINAAVM